jgi:hypothetical protein
MVPQRAEPAIAIGLADVKAVAPDDSWAVGSSSSEAEPLITRLTVCD